MVRYAQLVMGPAGSGKSSYCNLIQKHCQIVHRQVKVVNLDPAAEYFEYPLTADIRDLIQLDDVMDDESLHFGPNGGLLFCMEYCSKNFDWLMEQIDVEADDDYILFDCPGQIELYTHLSIMRQLVEQLEKMNFHVCGIFLLDSQFLTDTPKYFSGLLAALSVMVTLEIPHVNVMTKIDLLSAQDKEKLEDYLEPDMNLLSETNEGTTESRSSRFRKRYAKLNSALAQVIENYALIKFHPLDVSQEDSIGDLLVVIDNVLQYGEDLEVRDTVNELNDDYDKEENDY